MDNRMEMNDFAEDIATIAPLVCYETGRSRRIEARLYALFLALAISLITFVPSAAILFQEVKLPLALAITLAGLLVLLALTLCRNWILSGLRFCIVFFPDHLQMGRGLARRSFAYEDVDILYALPGPIFKVRCGKRTAAVFLDVHHKNVCLIHMRHFCPNAVVIDAKSCTLFPANPTRPEKIAAAVEGHFLRKAWIGSFASVYFACICIVLAWGLIDWWKGNVLVGMLLGDVLLRFMVCFLLITILKITWYSWRTAARIRRKRN
ncbi:MAG: hypothetical protein K8R46_00335 [Pirellulales bacterium]|nr:hypothetical protein [Pirellulales bacterium]